MLVKVRQVRHFLIVEEDREDRPALLKIDKFLRNELDVYAWWSHASGAHDWQIEFDVLEDKAQLVIVYIEKVKEKYSVNGSVRRQGH